MVNLRSGLVAGIGIVVLTSVGWLAVPTGEAPLEVESDAFASVEPAIQDLTVEPASVSDAAVAPARAASSSAPTAFSVPEAKDNIPTLELAAAVPSQAQPATFIMDPTPAGSDVSGRFDMASAIVLGDPVGDTKQACVVAFETIPPLLGAGATVPATRQLQVFDRSGAINVQTRIWRLFDDQLELLAGGEDATFDWAGHPDNNPLRLGFQDGIPPADNVIVSFDNTGEYFLELEIVLQSGERCVGRISVEVTECQDPPGATLAYNDMVLVNNALLPMHDWMPLFNVTLSASENEGTIARRALGPLTYSIGQGIEFFPDVNYQNLQGPRRVDILEFGLFFDSGPDGVPDQVFNAAHDSGPIQTWGNDGFPFGTVTEEFGGLTYELDFFRNGLGVGLDPENDSIPDVSPFEWPISRVDDPFGYIVAFRTSPTWRTGTTLRYSASGAFMVSLDNAFNDFFPNVYHIDFGCSADAEPVDSYPDPNALVPDEPVQYSSSFGAFDFSGATLRDSANVQNSVREWNLWNWSNRVYTPFGEQIRPRFDGVTQAFDMVMGEFLDLRTLFALETWYPVIGLNLHGAGNSFIGNFSGLREVNMIFTDIGGDPDNPDPGDPDQGNGGFDPRQGFDRFEDDWRPGTSGDTAINNDFSFQGVWVFFDTNNNGRFDMPQKSAAGGVTFVDHPMIPNTMDFGLGNFVDTYEPGWSYISHPEWGGDPAWKIRLRLQGTRRRFPASVTPNGEFEPVPDGTGEITAPFNSMITEDYFVVIRADSGFQDVSLSPGDGVGLDPAADFRAFVEPRNFNSELLWYDQFGSHQGGWDGGIYTQVQRNVLAQHLGGDKAGHVVEPNEIIAPYQNDPQWSWPYADGVHYHSLMENPPSTANNNDEPWWPQRNHNWNSVKIQRGLVEVHDLVMLYDTNNELAKTTYVDYAQGEIDTLGFQDNRSSQPFGPIFSQSPFDNWLDPYNEVQDLFYDAHSVGVGKSGFFVSSSIAGVAITTDDNFIDYQYSFETIPFFDNIFDRRPFGPRSPFYVPPNQQPTLPDYFTWPPGQNPGDKLPSGELPQLTDWPQTQRRARLLRQHTDVLSVPTAMLGFNFAGADDPVTNRIVQTALEEITVAFWGPDFTPSDLLPLDRGGMLEDTGVLLYQDSGAGGALGGGVFDSTFGGDSPVALNNLAWRNIPEPVDLDGDFVADDINGDGSVDVNDHCWVIRLRPRNIWTVPTNDERAGEAGIVEGNIGDDLFLVVRTSESIRRFENFRAFVPASLPSRSLSDRVAGIKLAPNTAIPSSGLVKQSPEENAVRDWYGHDMLENNVPSALTSLVGDGTTISPIAEEPTAVVGIDVSTNRPYSEAQPFTSATLGEGTRGAGSLSVQGNPFAAGALIGDYLIDSNYEPFEITANTANTVTFLSGTPAAGPWIIAREPTFLEQVIVEFYDVGNDGGFTLSEDLLLLNQEDLSVDPPVLSGVSLYRDNDWHPDNRDGIFDPEIDIVVKLDDPPVRIGVQGEPQQQVKFVFSSPGTDDLADGSATPRPRAQQPRLRQWVPDSWNEENTETQPAPGESPDFFVVIRASAKMQIGDDFRVGLVSWGPNTPTEPDPDQFTNPPPPQQPQDEFDIFSEFAWGARGLGFITFFKTPPTYHFWERTRNPGNLQLVRATQQQDITGFNWMRSTANKAVQTGIVTAASEGSIIITAVDPTELPRTVEAGGLPMRIDGRGFGDSPIVTIGGVQIAPDSATDNSITITIPEGTQFTQPVVLTVENSETGEVATWTQFTIIGGSGLTINLVTPNQLPRIIPPGGLVLTITGFGFGTTPAVDFGGQTLQLQSAADELILAVLPAGLDLSTLELVLTVTNPTTDQTDSYSNFVLVDIQLLTASPNVLPVFLPPSGLNVTLGGTGFGDAPIVTMNGVQQEVISATDTTIVVAVNFLGAVTPGEFIPVSVTNTELNVTATREDLIRIGNLPADDAATATLEITDGIANAGKDGHALVPLSDWVPLFHINMSFGDDPAPRVLSKLRYVITFDGANERDYGRVAAPEVSDLLEFAMFRNFGNEGDAFNSQARLDAAFDSIVTGANGEPAVWDNRGNPIGRLISDQQGFLEYEVDFIGTGTPADPQFPIFAAGGDLGAQYIVAVRTSATWRSMIAMGFDVLSAEMVDPNGNFLLDDEGAPRDEYTPDFFVEGDTLEPETGYSSSFAAWDISGYSHGTYDISFFNAWAWPQHLYTPAAEHIRPRWDSVGTVVDFVPGEWMDLRNVFSVDTWNSVVGINLHSTQSVHVFDPLRTAPHHLEDFNFTPEITRLMEVNVVMTDIGGDPNGPAGSGGFDPRVGLDRLTPNFSGPLDDNVAVGLDHSFNGLWVWHDTNNNGVFDPPTMVPADQNGGITFNGDWPMAPLNDTAITWEYVPFPPTGGDPWWKLKIRLDGLRRIVVEGNVEEDFVEGSVEPVPDQLTPFENLDTGSDYSLDYFLVFRSDSGYMDASRDAGDGAGITPGADFRMFVEPRRFNPATGHTTGGIYVDSMIPGPGLEFFGFGGDVWQDDVRWGVDEPWWPQRTTNHNSAKPMRAMVDVHDLVMTYDSSSQHRVVTEIELASRGAFGVCFGYADAFNAGTVFDAWMDPFGLLQSQFLNRHSVGVPDAGNGFFVVETIPLDNGQVVNVIFNTDDLEEFRQYPYETVPFFIPSLDNPLDGPRSPQFPNPPAAPSLPTYGTWPAHSEANVYPRASDWAPEDRAARLLKQHVDSSGPPTAMLGINLAGSGDPVVNRGNQIKLSNLTVAFWGPDFTPSDLAPLDPTGKDPQSGVLLWEDISQTGTFEGRLFETFFASPATLDLAVELQGMAWAPAAELIDLDGDGVADDMNGDGAVDDRDKAWVLTLRPAQLWQIPDADINNLGGTLSYFGCLQFFKDLQDEQDTHSIDVPYAPEDAPKALQRTEPNTGDDLFVTVRTSRNISRFEQFRAVIPATLPERATGQRNAGIQLSPVLNVSPGAYEKLHPEEGPVQEFYGHDMLEANVPVEILDLTQANQTIPNSGATVPVLALDVSTNTPGLTLAEGQTGTGGLRSFTVQNAAWGPGTFAGLFLIDSNYESFEITGNTANRLDLLSGVPATGRWRIVKNPTFLEQMIIEIYDEGADGDFNVATDLLPLVQDMTVSGIAIYRDNDSHPGNRNGQFDAGIDIPLMLDGPPVSTATTTGPENQFLFVFSSPGTDNVPKARDQQLRHRQWVPDTFAPNNASEFTGADFFVVVRASSNLAERDDFRIGIVGWGPNTPTAPDPDTFLSGSALTIKQYEEFPWGSRALGFITMLNDPYRNYSLEGFQARTELDASGFDFIRSSSSKKRRTMPIIGRKPPVSPNTIRIDSVSESQLPQSILPGESFSVAIYGNNFGTRPQVNIGGYAVTLNTMTNETISCSLTGIEGLVPQEPVMLLITNPDTGETASRSDLFRLRPMATNAPVITSVSPNRGGSTAFPVTIRGSNFSAAPYCEVLFGSVKMDILSATPTQISVGFPRGGFPRTGAMDVTVRNLSASFVTAGQHILVGGFTYENGPQGGGVGCSAAGAHSDAMPMGDILLLAAVLALCLAVRPWKTARSQ